MKTCPRCNGEKGGDAIMCGPGSRGYGWMPCSFCEGYGFVDSIQMLRYEQGERIRKERCARDVSVREEAARLGITVTELSGIEHGRMPQTAAGYEALARRIEEVPEPPIFGKEAQ